MIGWKQKEVKFYSNKNLYYMCKNDAYGNVVYCYFMGGFLWLVEFEKIVTDCYFKRQNWIFG